MSCAQPNRPWERIVFSHSHIWFLSQAQEQQHDILTRHPRFRRPSSACTFEHGTGRRDAELSDKAFATAQSAGKSILVDIYATWCPTCKAQEPILADLQKSEKFKDFVVFRVDFDDQKDVVKRFGARSKSTLIVYKGTVEAGRSVGDTRRASIESLLGKAN
jgi:thioredoxin 1